MPQFIHFVTALLATYFVSRLIRRVPQLRQSGNLLAIHTLAFVAVMIGLALFRWPDLFPSLQSLGLLALGQTVWLVVDGLRARYVRRRRSD